MIVHYLVGAYACCARGGDICTTDRAKVTCKRCISAMDAGMERPLRPYLPSGRKPLKRKPKVEEPKETMDAAGLRIVLDAPQHPLKRTDYP